MGTTRQPTIHLYSACRNCEYDISGYGKCKKGYDNFYYRLGKDNGCNKCKDEKHKRRSEENFWQTVRRK